MQNKVFIGMPTYNRPEGLRRALESVANQSRLPDEVLISDNAGLTDEAQRIASEFIDRIPGLKFFRQSQNIGATNNFLWLLEQASTSHFMWLADDDEFADENLLASLMGRFAREPDLVLVFPEIAAFFDDARTNWSKDINAPIFGGRQSDWDYLKAFCGYGGGHSFYGLYDRQKLVDANPREMFDSDLAYFNEGRFLHGLFIAGGVRFEPAARMIYNGTSAAKHSNAVLLKAFFEYSKRIHKLYAGSDITLLKKMEALRRVAGSHYPYLLHLFKSRNVPLSTSEN